MPSLAFNSTPVNLMNSYFTGTFYAHLVQSAPAATATTVANLTLLSGGNYSSKTLSGQSVTQSGTGGQVTYSNPVWTALTATAGQNVAGLVVCKQAGGSPASTDQIISYNELTATATLSAAAASGATSISVNALSQPIASGATITFTNGVVATTTAAAAAGATTISVNALSGSIPSGTTGTYGYLYTPNGADFTASIGANGVYRIQ